MHPIHLQQTPDTAGLGIRFPEDRCLNCGTRIALQDADLELRHTTFLLFGGIELLLRFPVTSCAGCAASMSRRALPAAQRIIVIGLCIAVVTTFVFLAVSLDLDMPAWLKSHWLAISVIGGGVPPWLWFERQKPTHPQTSYYQPVRLRRLKRSFLEGRIDRIDLGFTNPDVLRAFRTLNAPLIDAGLLVADAV
jgi:uncharacterized protein (DUF983 family)